MFSTILVACVLAANPEGAANATPDLDTYKQVKAQAGRDADSQIRLALWCEAHGMTAERIKHLTIATLVDPQNATARGLLGMVQHEGKWLSPDAIAEQLHNDPNHQAIVREYLDRRAKTVDKPEDQNKLALWCEENGLKDQAQAHFHRTVQLDPSREQAWKHLGYKKEKGRWARPEQLAAEKEMFELQTKATKYWKPILAKLWNELTSRKPEERAKAQESIDEIKDPAAVPMVWQTFAQKDTKRQEVAVRLLGQIDAASASRALAMLSILTQSPDIQREAVVILKQRDPRDFVEVLTSLIRKPIEYEVRRKAGLNSPGELFIKGREKNVKRVYGSPTIPDFQSNGPDIFSFDTNGLPVISRNRDYYQLLAVNVHTRADAGPVSLDEALQGLGWSPAVPTPRNIGPVKSQLARLGISENLVNSISNRVPNSPFFGSIPTVALERVNTARIYDHFRDRMEIPIGQMNLEIESAELRIQNDVQDIEQHNKPIRTLNRKARQTLSDAIGVDLGDAPEQWEGWTTELYGRLQPIAQSKQEVPTVTEEILPENPSSTTVINEYISPVAVRMASCFAAGTMVHTNDGLQRIEKIQPGDLVLSQDTNNGRISYNPVLNVFHNPPKETFKISFEGSSETVSPTGIHRFWKTGQGWVMARDLKPGDVLRTIGGSVTIRAIDPDQTQPVFNLRVGNAEDFFVGQAGVLAHDNKVVGPVDKPFDRIVSTPTRTTDRH